MVTVAIVMTAMIWATAGTAMASSGESASGAKVCNAPGIAHATAPEQNSTAHSNIPRGEMF